MEAAAPGVLPLFVGHFRDVGSIDFAVGSSSKRFQFHAIRFRQRRQSFQRVDNHFRLHKEACANN
jgi:hypothetical protein